MKFDIYIYGFLYLIINNLFLYKYASRQNFIDVTLLITLYSIFIIIFFLKNPIQNKKINYNLIFYIVTIATALGITFFLINTNPYSLKVDRWVALNNTNNAIFSGEYPYTILTHLKNISSNFPGLVLLSIPFYLLGNVGYFLLFSFLLFSFTVYKIFNIQKSLYALLLLTSSVAFWYEISVLSDLVGNTIVVVCTIALLKHYNKDNLFTNSLYLGIIIAILTLTRLIYVFPIILFLWSPFLKISTISKLKFLAAFIITCTLLISFVLKDVEDWNTLLQYNPLSKQTVYSSHLTYFIVFAIMAVILFFKNNNYSNFYQNSLMILSGILLSSFFLKIFEKGFNKVIFTSHFDISYLGGILIPFIIFSYLTDLKKIDA